jgi:ATPase subunit of ABC transporter with duplicated ATPase domains
VVLDEPTNHLDLPSIERLQRALASYPGALIVVSHDEKFARGIDLEPFDLP